MMLTLFGPEIINKLGKEWSFLTLRDDQYWIFYHCIKSEYKNYINKEIYINKKF